MDNIDREEGLATVRKKQLGEARRYGLGLGDWSAEVADASVGSSVVLPVGAFTEFHFAHVQSAFDLLRVESESGKNVGRLDKALTSQDWDTLNKYSREYDAYLRGGEGQADACDGFPKELVYRRDPFEREQ